MNKQQLASKIWEAANKMRSKIEANEYKDYILGFIFYKFLSDKEEELLIKDGWSIEDMAEGLVEEDSEVVKYCQDRIGYFIEYKNLFSTWLRLKGDFYVSNVSDALSAFSRLIKESHKKVFDKIFDTLDTGLSKLGDSSDSQKKAIIDLIDLIKDIPMDGKQGYDVLGFIYEYLISMFAANAGKKAGEFYTPHEVSLLMSEIVAEHLQDREKIEIYDPTSGSGSLLINIGQSVAKRMNNRDNIKYFAQELKENTYNLTRMNLVMRGIIPANICTRCGDTLKEDWPFFDEKHAYEPLYVDAVVSNPPYSQNWDPANKESDPRYKRYGIAPKTKADYAFLLHDLYHIKPDGIMTIVLPHGVLFRGGEEERIRKNLIENNNIDAIIGLPANIFFGTGIPTIIMVLKQKRENTDVMIIDASKGFEKVGKSNKLRASDIKRIVDALVAREDVPKFARKVSKEEIQRNGYNLNIPRYVDSSEKAESWDIYATIFGGIPQSEIEELNEYWAAFPSLKSQLFTETDTPYSTVAVENVISAIGENEDVKNFASKYQMAFADFEKYLENELINGMMTVPVSMEEARIAKSIFERLSDIPLIDRYDAYQLLNNEWGKIATDLEMLQTEGFDTVKRTDPRYVTKKDKSGKDAEVQDGWVGHIIPFELIQATILKEQSDALKGNEKRLAEIAAEYEELLDTFTAEEKDEEKDLFTEENDAFVAAAVTKRAKALQKTKRIYGEDTIEYRIIKVADLIEEEKAVKRQIKEMADKLLKDTKVAIESLSNEQAIELLKAKWIQPLCDRLAVLPDSIVSALETKINALTKKYSVTLQDVESDIEKSERAFSEMIDELEGSEYDMIGLKELQKMLKGE